MFTISWVKLLFLMLFLLFNFVTGVAAILQRENPHLVTVHCVAHKLALRSSQAAADITMLKKHQETLTNLFYYFKGSSKRAAKIKEIQNILDDPVLTYKEMHSVRWLSYYNALVAVYRTMDSLLTYMGEQGKDGSKDPKAVGLKREVRTN